ncbi:hypothetical protein ES332_A06G171700v1 [Gossypium tomentosum]|uniref:Uncharacterized protein n=1 Tax=Gossypium tomentosum TaxID=34277 RepID=A0A5D2Q588_GOSTO|nr:hypothetical protein ES332_A06G171700v1 [Gossypium tomentosum]
MNVRAKREDQESKFSYPSKRSVLLHLASLNLKKTTPFCLAKDLTKFSSVSEGHRRHAPLPLSALHGAKSSKADVGAVGARESGARGVLDVSVDMVRKIRLLGTACGCYSSS